MSIAQRLHIRLRHVQGERARPGRNTYEAGLVALDMQLVSRGNAFRMLYLPSIFPEALDCRTVQIVWP